VSSSIPTSSYRLDDLSGKTTFLVYYLIRELARAQPTIYFFKGRFYIFTNVGVHLIDREPDFGKAWKSITCLVGLDVRKSSPIRTMTTSFLFVLSASSPRPDHRNWIKQRPGSHVFVLNPPSQDELTNVLVQSFIPPHSAHTLQSL
jgi:hypothetical protein